ncbi:hypothetical protein OZD67_04185 [Wolbachia endosymbiont of Drosophila nikananu]|uniref:hypothetical protein n=1 Tax=Wolbachia endosymbiont of Drosophila nikananu TaxID=375550 RepID=UPI0023A936F7|nr:hypothetical protein [Wolbachia endosymbiont of Drosophila nikananu]MDE5061302.1 hypothetical protein [Wolbachia endosymbiont of Drosophila nikananu]
MSSKAGGINLDDRGNRHWTTIPFNRLREIRNAFRKQVQRQKTGQASGKVFGAALPDLGHALVAKSGVTGRKIARSGQTVL